MSDLQNGMLVQHASLGLGKVVALEPKAIHVFFATSDARFATKLRLPMALPLLTPAATGNAWLSRLSGFELDIHGLGLVELVLIELQVEHQVLAVGLVVLFGMLVAFPLTGGAMNLARVFGTDAAANHWADFGSYFIGLIGGFVAGMSYNYFFASGEGETT